jgi:CubicO group peptidase (beta-lactamase class C family)
MFFTGEVFSQNRGESDPLEGFPEYVEKLMTQWKVPGMAIGVVKDNKVIIKKGYGYRDVQKALPVTHQTLFGIGSCSKAFTAMAISMLIDDKKFEWDTPVREFMPDFKLYDEYATINATSRDLLYHRTGIRGHNMVKNISSIDRADLFRILRYLEPNKGFREYFQYSNLMYQVAGHIVDRTSGSTYEQFVSERIFKPLGMRNSTISLEEFQKLDNIAHPYLNFSPRSTFGKVFYNSDYYSIIKSYNNLIAPSGGIYSCVEDMVEWLKLYLNEGKVGKERIVSARNLRIMHTPTMGIRYYPNNKEEPLSAYGMGWFIRSYCGNYLLEHGGQLDGYMAHVSFMPFEKIGVVVLTNLYYQHLATIITDNIYHRLLGLEWIDRSEKSLKSLENASKSLEKRTAEFWTNRPKPIEAPHSLEKFAGIYENVGYGRIEVANENNTLRAVFKNMFRIPLRHFNQNIFATESDIWDYNHIKFHFYVNEKNEINRLSIPLESSVDDIVFNRIK